jgi:uncharacterized protein (TIGR04562 family)
MKHEQSQQEMYHEIFGSVLDRTEMTPYLLLKTGSYGQALGQATKMLGNRGFDLSGQELEQGEMKRAARYINNSFRYCFVYVLPFLKKQLKDLSELESANKDRYKKCLASISRIEELLNNNDLREVIEEDPRHLLLLASSKKYPYVFHGYKDISMDVPDDWQQMACSLLKVAYLIKSIEEDSQDVNDYAQLGIFLEIEGQSLQDLYNYDWEHPVRLPVSDAAKRAFVKISTFFHKLRESMHPDNNKGCLVFDSGDGVNIDIEEIKARLKSPASMFTKLGKDIEGEAHNIRDILAITFILRNSDDTLKLFHALQKRGVILQENTISPSITQTLFKSPEEMQEAVRNLIISLSQSEGKNSLPDHKELIANAEVFYRALSINPAKNYYSSEGHRKFQCKINYSVPIHRSVSAGSILVPGTPEYEKRAGQDKITEQHTLALELRISDRNSWHESEYKEDSHHDAYKFRQMISVMNRVFRGSFHFPDTDLTALRKDQKKLFKYEPG